MSAIKLMKSDPAAMEASPVPIPSPPEVWAKAGTARNKTESVMNRYCSLRILSPCFRKNLPPVGG